MYRKVHPKIYAGKGTIAIEILEQNKAIDTIIVPIGGGGLITGIAVAAKAIKPDIRIIGVIVEVDSGNLICLILKCYE